ncbi:hypothetical protein HY11_09810 [Hyphomonas pacifica]|nr:hypothetical protein HY11_09810 [Hyphomonas pacifica]
MAQTSCLVGLKREPAGRCRGVLRLQSIPRMDCFACGKPAANSQIWPAFW